VLTACIILSFTPFKSPDPYTDTPTTTPAALDLGSAEKPTPAATVLPCAAGRVNVERM